MIELKTLRELIKLMVSNDLTELDLQDQGERVSLKRGRGEPQVHYVPAPQGPANPVTAAGAPGSIPAAPGANGNTGGGPSNGNGGSSAADAGLVAVTSPMVGTFYAAPNPDSKPFAAIGDRISAETVVCIVEAMKVFNEIKAEKAGVIEKIMVTSGQAVEFGQPLFLVRPA